MLLAAALERIPQIQAPSHAQQEAKESKPSFLRDLASDNCAYSHIVAKVLPTYLGGCLVVFIVAAVGAYAFLHPKDPALFLLPGSHLLVVWGFGVYAGIRDGVRLRRRFSRFHWAGIATAAAATFGLTIVSVAAQGLSVEVLPTLRNVLTMCGAFISAYFLFIFGAMLGQYLARGAELKAAEQTRPGTSGGGASSPAQAWVSIVGAAITALASVLSALIPTFAGKW